MNWKGFYNAGFQLLVLKSSNVPQLRKSPLKQREHPEAQFPAHLLFFLPR
jgi:hypothetical protein